MRLLISLLISLMILFSACGKDQQTQRQTDNKPNSTSQANPESISNSPQNSIQKGSSDWQMFMYDIAYRGLSPDKKLHPPLSLLWKFKTGGNVNSSPVVSGGTVYVGSDDHRLYALNANSWGVKWEFEAGNKITTAPTIYRSNVYFSTRDLKVYALDASTGTKKWESQVDGWVNSPLVAYSDKIYVGCYENKIYILNALTGNKEGDERARINIGGVEYACVNGEFFPIDAFNRASVWKKAILRTESWPAIANGFAYIGSRDKKIYAFDTSSRRQVWNFETDGWVDSSPAIADGKLYIGSRDGYVYAFENMKLQDATSNSTSNDGVVTRDRVDVYQQPDGSSGTKIVSLNEGTFLPIVDKKSGNWYLDTTASWFQVKLPNGRKGWINAENFIRAKWINDLLVNASLIKDLNSIKLPKEAETISWSPDGADIAYFANVTYSNIYWMAQSIWSASGNGSESKWVSDGSFFNSNVTWSGDGGWFVFENMSGTERQIWMARFNGTGLRKITIGEAPSISPKGDEIAFIRRGKVSTTLWTRRLDTDAEKKIAEFSIKGQESYIAYGYNAGLTPPTWSKDDSRIAIGLDGYHYNDKFTRVAVLKASGGLIKELSVRAWKTKDLAFSPDGKKIAYVTQEHSSKEADESLDKQVHVATLLDGESHVETFKHCESIAWSANGRYLAFVEEDDSMGINRKIWILDTVKWKRIQLLSSKEIIEKIVWLNNGKIIVLARSDSPKPSGLSKKLQESPKPAMIKCWSISLAPLPK